MPDEVEASNKRLSGRIKRMGLAIFLFGLVMPTEWKLMLGVFAAPISWLAEMVPSIRKAVEISPISKIVEGFFGVVALLLPLIYTYLYWRDPVGARFKYALDRAASKLSFIVLIYLLVVPMYAFVLYVILTLPIDVHLGLTPTRGQLVFSLMVSYRLTLAIFGSFILLGACGFVWLLTIFLLGPFFYALNRLRLGARRMT